MKVKIKEEIVEKLKERVESTGEFESVEEYINSILAQVVERLNSKIDTNTISIPNELANKIREKIKGSGFTSLSSYVIYILRQTVFGIKIDEKEETTSKKDKKPIEDRIKDLGYIGLK